MKKVKIIEGVVAEYNGKYWGTQYSDGHCTGKDFGDLEKAEISDPRYCKKPTDKTYDPENTNGCNPEYDKLSKAKLVKVKKTITTDFEILLQ
jgi:hypothetical protein